MTRYCETELVDCKQYIYPTKEEITKSLEKGTKLLCFYHKNVERGLFNHKRGIISGKLTWAKKKLGI